MSDAETPHDGFFSFRIFRRTGGFGETAASENAEVARLLRAAAHAIESGVPIGREDQRQVKCRSGHAVADFEYGPGMIRGEGPGFDRTHMNLPSAAQLANAPRRA
jgi:hypothetical protein